MDRKANQKDEKQIYQLMCQLEQTQLPYDRFAEIFRQQLAKEQYYCLVWEEEGRVVGVLNLRWEGQLHHAGKVAEILELIVSPDCRNQGVGRKMFARACQLAQDLAAEKSKLPATVSAPAPTVSISGKEWSRPT